MEWGHTCNAPVEWLVPAHCSLSVCLERADLGLGWAGLGWAGLGLGWAGSLPLNQLQDCAASSRTTVSQGNQRQLGQKLGCLGLTWPGTWQAHTGMTHGACSHVPTSQHSAMQILDLSKISVYTFILWTLRHTYTGCQFLQIFNYYMNCWMLNVDTLLELLLTLILAPIFLFCTCCCATQNKVGCNNGRL